MKRTHIIIILLVVLVVGFFGFNGYIYYAKQKTEVQQPNISFEELDFNEEIQYEDQALSNSLSMQYIHPVDWPPQVHIIDEPYQCTSAGNEFERAGITEEKFIERHTYCVTKVSEGAAGSTYTQYAYAFPQDEQTAIVTFSLRFTQCANYDEPQQSECESERTSFDPDTLYTQTNVRIEG